LLIYGSCQRDLEDNILTYKKSIDDEYLEDMVNAFLGKKNITLFDSLPGCKKIENVSLALQSEYQKEFAILTGLIKDEAAWDDKEKTDHMMKKIFTEHS
jgi:hypothetical protein